MQEFVRFLFLDDQLQQLTSGENGATELCNFMTYSVCGHRRWKSKARRGIDNEPATRCSPYHEIWSFSSTFRFSLVNISLSIEKINFALGNIWNNFSRFRAWLEKFISLSGVSCGLHRARGWTTFRELIGGFHKALNCRLRSVLHDFANERLVQCSLPSATKILKFLIKQTTKRKTDWKMFFI